MRSARGLLRTLVGAACLTAPLVWLARGSEGSALIWWVALPVTLLVVAGWVGTQRPRP